jgi:CDP-diacylglycerol--glycerol-3-phosphate 3-phosphatidyltransferase
MAGGAGVLASGGPEEAMKTTIYIITFSRLGFAAVFSVLVAVAARTSGVSLGMAAALIGVAIVGEITDTLDGQLARRTDNVTELGGLLDPLMDSLSRLIMFFALGLVGWVTIAVPLVMGFRDIVVSYTRIIQARTGGKTSARWSGKIKAIVQAVVAPVVVACVWFGGAFPAWETSATWTIHGFSGILIVVTLWSMLDYIRGAWKGIHRMYKGTH